MDDNPVTIETKKRGRPKGSKNRGPTNVRNVPDGPRQVPEGQKPFDDYRVSDPMAMVSRLYTELDFQLSAVRNSREQAKRSSIQKGEQPDTYAIDELTRISGTLVKALQAHKAGLALAEELAKKKTPKQLLDLAIARVKGQDLPTVRAIIRDLRQFVGAIAPVVKQDKQAMGDPLNQSVEEAFAEMDDDNEPDAT